MPSTHRGAAIAVAAVLTAVTLVACSSGDSETPSPRGTFQFHSPGGQTEIIYAEEERAPLPDFSGPSLMEEGEEISLSVFEGEVVVLNAWGQWCAPCRAEVDNLQLVHADHGDVLVHISQRLRICGALRSCSALAHRLQHCRVCCCCCRSGATVNAGCRGIV